MKINGRISITALALASLFNACKSGQVEVAEKTTKADPIIKEVRTEYAPDKRVALFDVEARKSGNQLIIKGESNLPDAVAELKQKLQAQNIAYVDSIQMLPSEDLEGKTESVIQISVANLRSRPSHSAELVTQAILGTPVKVYKKDGGWYYIQTPEGYLAWVDYGGVTPMTPEALAEWRASEKLIFMDTFGFSYSEPDTESQEVSDLVAGNILELLGEENGFYKVKYPHGKIAYIEQDKALLYENWLASLEQTPESLVETSKNLMGLPYLWGGTSAKGVDCSGYTKTVFFLNGIILPRDASQQIHAGIEVDSTRDFENLEPGDLLFFGRKATADSPERVIHVGMWIGDNKFIHSMGDVHISNFDKNAPDFDEYNYNRYLRTKRILGQEDEKLIQLTESELFMDRK